MTSFASAVIRVVHGRMPLILGLKQFDVWLDPKNPDPGDVLTHRRAEREA